MTRTAIADADRVAVALVTRAYYYYARMCLAIPG
jgi:hypothetical protein